VETIGRPTVVNCAVERAGDGAPIRYDGRSVPARAMLPPGRRTADCLNMNANGPIQNVD